MECFWNVYSDFYWEFLPCCFKCRFCPIFMESYRYNGNGQFWLNRYCICCVNTGVSTHLPFLPYSFVCYSLLCLQPQDRKHPGPQSLQAKDFLRIHSGRQIDLSMGHWRPLRASDCSWDTQGFFQLSSVTQVCFGSCDRHQTQAMGCIVFQEIYLSPGSRTLECDLIQN